MNPFKKLTLSLGVLLLLAIPLEAQINNSLYFMHGVPQSNRINPAHQPRCGFYLGMPGLAPLRMELASSSLGYGDFIYPHPTQDSLITFLHPLGDKEAFLNLLDPVNFVVSDLGVSLLSVGFGTPVGFFSLDVTSRIDGSLYYPGDLARLLFNGTEDGVTYELDGMGVDLTAFQEISVGWSGDILDNLQVGARAKMLFGIANMSTTQSNLSVTTSQDLWNIDSDMMFNASLPFGEFLYDQDGMIDSVIIDQELESAFDNGFNISPLLRYGFNTRNFGLGLDVGVNYRPIESLLISASVTDLGYMKWNDGVNDVSYQMDFDFRGIEINPFGIPEGQDFGEYLDSTVSQMADSLSNFLTFTPGRAYSRRLNTKLFVGASYFITPYINFGILSRTDFLSEKIAQQVTATANFTTGRFVNFTLSYSYINDYFKNVGAGLAFNVGPLNMYLISDNLLNAALWPQEARSVNLWFGMNLVFGYQKFKRDAKNDLPLLY